MTSRREEKEQRRAERVAREQQEHEQARRRRVYSIVVGGLLAAATTAALIVAILAGGSNEASGGGDSGGVPAGADSYEGAVDPPLQEATELVPAAKAAKCTLRNPTIKGRTHVTELVEYNTNPPNSGNHDPQWAGDGVYDRTFNPRDTMYFVHTLEHGRVEIHYDPRLEKRRVDQLGGLFNEDPYHMVLLPNRSMDYQLAATAWGHLMGCNEVNDETFDAIRAFRERYRDQGPEQVP